MNLREAVHSNDLYIFAVVSQQKQLLNMLYSTQLALLSAFILYRFLVNKLYNLRLLQYRFHLPGVP